MQEPKADRRIVSRAEYAGKILQKLVLIFAGGMTGFIVLAFGIHLLHMLYSHADARPAVPLYMAAIACFVGLFAIIRTTYKDVTKIDPGLPLTRANTADLPAPDSLMRASQEPAQAQKGVLLRGASGEAQAGQAEQLLRASVGGQD